MIRLKRSATAVGIAALLLVAALFAVVVGNTYSAYPAMADEEEASTVVDGAEGAEEGDGAEDGEEISGTCSILVEPSQDIAQLASMSVTIDVYLIATMNEAAALEPTDDFASVQSDIEAFNEHAYDDKTRDEYAEKLVASATPVANSLPAGPYKTEQFSNGSCLIENLQEGLYLLVPRPVSSADYDYTFSPMLVPAPSWENGETVTENIPAYLKASQSTRQGSLEIVKSLKSMDLTLGNPTFVFDVKAVDAAGTTIYSNLHTLSFTEAGQKSISIVGIFPVGTTITVTEVYSGASYVATTDTTQTVTIAADAMQQQVVFENEPNDDRKTGTGIENAFSKGGNGWRLVQRTAEGEVAA